MFKEANEVPVERHSVFPLTIGENQEVILGLTKLEYMAAEIAGRSRVVP